MVTVVVADDHDVFRAGLVRRLRRHARLHVVGEALDGDHALQLIRRHRPRVAVVDLRMPRLGGLDVARAITSDASMQDVRVVLLSGRHDADLVRTAHAAGAVACLDKALSRSVLCDALLEAATSSTPPSRRAWVSSPPVSRRRTSPGRP